MFIALCGFDSLGSAVVAYDRLLCRTSCSGFFQQGCFVRASLYRGPLVANFVLGLFAFKVVLANMRARLETRDPR